MNTTRQSWVGFEEKTLTTLIFFADISRHMVIFTDWREACFLFGWNSSCPSNFFRTQPLIASSNQASQNVWHCTFFHKIWWRRCRNVWHRNVSHRKWDFFFRLEDLSFGTIPEPKMRTGEAFGRKLHGILLRLRVPLAEHWGDGWSLTGFFFFQSWSCHLSYSTRNYPQNIPHVTCLMRNPKIDPKYPQNVTGPQHLDTSDRCQEVLVWHPG